MLQNCQPRRNIRSFHLAKLRRPRTTPKDRPRTACDGGQGRELSTANYLPYDCRAAFRQTYWTSGFRKSMSLSGPAGVVAGQRVINSAAAQGADSADPGESRWEFHSINLPSRRGETGRQPTSRRPRELEARPWV